MTPERWFGLFFLAAGIYLVVCSRWKQDFILYRMKVARVKWLFGDKFTHGFYFVLGVACTVAGVLKATGIWGPPA